MGDNEESLDFFDYFDEKLDFVDDSTYEEDEDEEKEFVEAMIEMDNMDEKVYKLKNEQVNKIDEGKWTNKWKK